MSQVGNVTILTNSIRDTVRHLIRSRCGSLVEYFQILHTYWTLFGDEGKFQTLYSVSWVEYYTLLSVIVGIATQKDLDRMYRLYVWSWLERRHNWAESVLFDFCRPSVPWDSSNRMLRKHFRQDASAVWYSNIHCTKSSFNKGPPFLASRSSKNTGIESIQIRGFVPGN